MARRHHRRRYHGYGDPGRRHRRRHHRRHYSDALVTMPSFAGIQSRLKEGLSNKAVKTSDVAVGVGLGIVGGAAVKYALNKVWDPTKQPTFLKTYAVPITSVAAGVLALAFEKNRARAHGHFLGAVLAGGAPLLWGLFAKTFPQFADPLFARSYEGLITGAPISPYGGLLTASPQPTAFGADAAGVMTAAGVFSA